jgi:hypothetical protein
MLAMSRGNKKQDMIRRDETPNSTKPCTGSSRKLLPKFKGPFTVTRVIFNDRYEVEDLRETRHNQRTVVSPDKIKRWITMQT